MRVVADTGPIVAAANVNDSAHELAALLLNEIGRDLIVLEPVIAEVDYLMRGRIGSEAARAFLRALILGEHRIATVSPGVFRRAVELDAQHADLELGIVDAVVMAYAERNELPVLTFDFRDFRASKPATGFWRLVIDEGQYREATGS